MCYVFGVVRKRHLVKYFISKKVVYCHVYHRGLKKPCQYYSFIPRSILRKARSLFRSDISTKRDLVLPLSISSIFEVPLYYSIAAYVFILVFPSVFHTIACFKKQFLRKLWPIQLAFLVFIVYRIPPSSQPPSWLHKILVLFSQTSGPNYLLHLSMAEWELAQSVPTQLLQRPATTNVSKIRSCNYGLEALDDER